MVKSIFKGRVLDINLERITLPNGNDVDLEIIRHPGGACALPLHENGDVSLIRTSLNISRNLLRWTSLAPRLIRCSVVT